MAEAPGSVIENCLMIGEVEVGTFEITSDNNLASNVICRYGTHPIRCSIRNTYYVRQNGVPDQFYVGRQGEVMGDSSGQLSGRVRLRISSDGNKYRFEYAAADESWQLLCEHDCTLLSTEVVGGFTGAIVGMFAEGEGSADFSYFKYTEN